MSQTLKAVLVGCGHIASLWAKALAKRQDVEIAALADVDQDRAQNFARAHGLNGKVHDSLERAIQAVEPDLVLEIAVPEVRAELVTLALRHGCHVLSEKPLAASLAQARALVDLAAYQDRVFAVMQNRRFNAGGRAIRQAIADGRLGALGFISADLFNAPHPGGFRETMAHPLLIDMAIHTFDQARFYTAADAVSVYCHAFNTPGSWWRGDAAASCIFEMSDGSTFSYRGCWTAHGQPGPWDSEWRIIGSGASLRWDGQSAPLLDVPDIETGKSTGAFFYPYERQSLTIEEQAPDPHEACLHHMIDAIQAGRQPETAAADNIKSLGMVFAAIESAEQGKKLDIG